VSNHNWPHQVGGLDDLMRPVPGIDDATRFHEGWEARIFGLARVADGLDLYSTDEFRHAIERLDPAEYARITYFEKWLAAIEHLAVARGYVSQEELEAAQRSRLDEHDHDHPHSAPAMAPHPDEHLDAPDPAERFAPGDAVIVAGGLGEHHRVPDWARGCRGVVHAVRGRFPLPDLVVAGVAGRPYTLYSIELNAADAFPDADGRDRLYVDAYDPYLRPEEEDR
jgi:nitrile hydratase